MSILDRLFKGRAAAKARQTPGGEVECPHLALAPRWDSAVDMGHEDRATSYVCDSCHRTFDPSSVERIRHEAAARLRIG